GRPVPVPSAFTAPAGGDDYLLRISRRPAAGRDQRAHVVVTLNGVRVVAGGDDDDDGAGWMIERRVALLLQNTLVVELRGAPGSGMTVQIVGYDAGAPTITTRVEPAP